MIHNDSPKFAWNSPENMCCCFTSHCRCPFKSWKFVDQLLWICSLTFYAGELHPASSWCHLDFEHVSMLCLSLVRSIVHHNIGFSTHSVVFLTFLGNSSNLTTQKHHQPFEVAFHWPTLWWRRSSERSLGLLCLVVEIGLFLGHSKKQKMYPVWYCWCHASSGQTWRCVGRPHHSHQWRYEDLVVVHVIDLRIPNAIKTNTTLILQNGSDLSIVGIFSLSIWCSEPTLKHVT